MNYYNENDPKAAAWLRELIRAGLIPPGVVDETSITEINLDELKRYTQCHFFAGIGGWSYALWLAGWPADKPVWTGSCPCQPFSAAGKRQVDKDKRHLWPAFRAAIAERRPAICFGEQVASADGRVWLAGVRTDLEELGYGVGAADLCAAGVGAPHRHQRLFWVANTNEPGGDERARGGQQPIRDEDRGTRDVANSKHDGGRAVEPGREAQGRTADGRPCGMADTEHIGRQRIKTATEPDRRSEVEHGGGVGNVADSECSERRPFITGNVCHRDQEGKETAGRLAACREAGRVGDASGGGRGERGDAALAGRGGHLERAGWSRYDIIPCRDGKARRIESGTFPLADGIPGRMGLLRGYGNAIVPQVAAEFIKAACEAVTAQQGNL